jgi:hypothetical protein
VDRELARKVLEVYPDGPLIAQANRAFLHRVVRYLTAQGVRQFIDIGSGIPTEGNVHETAQQDAPGARVLYVDHDPVAVVHSELILRDTPGARIVQADLRDPAAILTSAAAQELIDLTQPVAVLMVAVLHFIPDAERPGEIVAAFRDAVAPGSYLVISHATTDERADEAADVTALYKSTSDPGVTFRPRAQLPPFFDGWDLVEPGLVWGPQWRPEWPDDVDTKSTGRSFAVGVARKP